MAYEAVVGIEVHAELDTQTKLFCGCRTEFGSPPNTQVCPVCLGMPGVLPVMNRRAFDYALKMALALNCTVNPTTVFDRKNYYYPDLPKNYQISQSYHNLGENGYLDVIVDGVVKRIRIWNVHLEEDAGKLLHSETPGANYSHVDLNRAGRPLLEIVSAPDMRTSAEVDAVMRTLRNVLLYTGVSDCKIQEGKLRFEPSISLRPEGETELGARVEIKNVGSISAVVKAVDFEIVRQTELLESGGTVSQETRLWDEALNRTLAMRRKETSADYRYFPEPDLVKVDIDEAWVDAAREAIPELPVARRLRLRESLGLNDYDAAVLTEDRALADYFEACVREHSGSAAAVAKWVINDVQRRLNEECITIDEFACPPPRLGALVALVEKGELNLATAREVFAEMIETDSDPKDIVKSKGLAQISDDDAVTSAVDRVLAENPKPVADWKSGKKAAYNALFGRVMRETRGKANPKVVREVLSRRLEAQ